MLSIIKAGSIIIIGLIGGGIITKLTGFSFGWLIGAIVFVGAYQLQNRSSLNLPFVKYIKNVGQLLIGISIGQQFNIQIVNLFIQKWSLIILINILIMLISILFGLLMWLSNKKEDLGTCIISTSPGGISSMPAVSEEVGGDVITVSALHTLRLIIVVSLIPLLAFKWNEPNQVFNTFTEYTFRKNIPVGVSILILLIIGLVGTKMWEYFKLPVPFLTGSMVAVGIFNYFIDDKIYHLDIPLHTLQWPIILSQVLIGTTIGIKIDHTFFQKLKTILIPKGIILVGFILSLITFAYIFSNWLSIPFTTMLLAFSPGGVSEMTIVASSLNVDVPFVVSVQTLRLFIVVLTMPFILKIINKKESLIIANNTK